jgi:hypothetical protein
MITMEFNQTRNELTRIEKRLSDVESKEENLRVTELRHKKSELGVRVIKIGERNKFLWKKEY